MTWGEQIRPAGADDGPALASLLVRARQAAVPAIPPMVHDAADVLRWMSTVVLPQCEVWVAEAPPAPPNGLLVLRDDWVEQLFLDPAGTGRGLGTRLLDQAKARRPGGLRLWTFQSNVAARRFYERHGFVVAETTDGSGNEEGSPDVLYMWSGA